MAADTSAGIAHPTFRNATRMVARMYDKLHDPTYQDVLTTPTDTGGGTFTLYLGEVRSLAERPGEPLVFHGGTFGRIAAEPALAESWGR